MVCATPCPPRHLLSRRGFKDRCVTVALKRGVIFSITPILRVQTAVHKNLLIPALVPDIRVGTVFLWRAIDHLSKDLQAPSSVALFRASPSHVRFRYLPSGVEP